MGAATNQNASKGPRQYLLTADVDVDLFRTSGEIKITGPVEIIPDMQLYAEREGLNGGKPLPYRSNKFGYLEFDKSQFQNTQPVHLLPKQEFIVPPMDMLNLSWSMNSLGSRLDPKVEKESWHNAIISHITAAGFDKKKNSVELKILSIPFANMRKPKKVPTNDMPDLDRDYREWHEETEGKKIKQLQGYFIPRVRMVFCVFNNSLLLGAGVSLYNSTGAFIDDGVTVDAGDGAVIAVIAANKSQLPANETYKIEVDVSKPLLKFSGAEKEKWNAALISGAKYQFQEILTFGMGSRLGKYDVVMCDPIAVEETLLQQFPSEYEHLARYIKGSQQPKNELMHQFRGREEDLFSGKGIKTLAGQVKWASGKAGMVSGVLSSDANHKLALQLGKAINEQAAKVVHPDWKNGLNLAFQGVDVALAWKEFPKNIAKGIVVKIDKLADVKMIGSMDDIARAINKADSLTKLEYDTYKLFNYSSKSIPDFAGKGGFYDRQFFLKDLKAHAQNSVDLKEMPPVLGNRAKKIADMLDTVTKPIGWIASRYAVVNSWHDVYAKSDAFMRTSQQFKAMLLDYLKKSRSEFIHHDAAALEDQKLKTNGIDMSAVVPSREGIINLEKFRSSTVMSGRELDKATVDAAMATFDFALSVGIESGFPPAMIACAVIAIVKETAVFIGSTIDYLITLPLGNDEKSKLAVLTELRENSSENQDLMPDSESVITNNGIDDLNVQFRMRAEAFYGLAGLITRASATASESDAKKIQKMLDELAKIDQQEKDLGDNPDKTQLQKVVDERNAVIKELADLRNKILKDKVEKYKIKEYIQEFILNDGWSMPVKDLCTITLDTLHLFGDDTLSAGNVTDALVERNSKYSDLPALPFYFGAVIDSLLDHELKANFSKAFPVHNLSADSVLDLVKTFRMVQPEILRSNPVEYTCIFHRDSCMTDSEAKKQNLPDNGWELINNSERRNVKSLNEISTLSQIRIFILLKNDPIFAENLYPFELQLSRVDGGDILGPVYKGMVSALNPKQLLSHELKISGLKDGDGKKRFGIILHPSFKYGSHNLLGTKPMDHSAAGRYFDRSFFQYLNRKGTTENFIEHYKQHQVVGWEVQIGNTTDYKEFIRLGRPSDTATSKLTAKGKYREALNHKDDLQEYRIKIEDTNNIEKGLINNNFLLSRGVEWEMPKVLENSDYIFGIMMKFGDSDFIFISKSFSSELDNLKLINCYNKKPINIGLVDRGFRHGYGLLIQNYDWKTPIEVMALIRAGSHVEKNAKNISEVPITETTNMNWKNCIRFSFDVNHDNSWKPLDGKPQSGIRGCKNIKGPHYKDTLYYIGKREKDGVFNSGHLDSLNKPVSPDPKVDEAFDFVEKIISPSGDDRYEEILLKLRKRGDRTEEEFHIFASRISPDYTTPCGNEEISAFRPFAENGYVPRKGKYSDNIQKKFDREEIEYEQKFIRCDVVSSKNIKLPRTFPYGCYEYHLGNFKTSDGTLADEKAGDAFFQKELANFSANKYGNEGQFKILIEAPDNYYTDVPWEGSLEKEGDESKIDAWLTNNPESVGIPSSIQKAMKKQSGNSTSSSLSAQSKSKSLGSNSKKGAVKPKP